MPPPARGRPTEANGPVSEAPRFRVTPEELAGLKAVTAREGVTVSRLLRRAVREMVTGGPAFFDDAVAELSNVAGELARLERILRSAQASGRANGLASLQALLASTRAGFAEQVRRSRRRWTPRS